MADRSLLTFFLPPSLARPSSFWVVPHRFYGHGEAFSLTFWTGAYPPALQGLGLQRRYFFRHYLCNVKTPFFLLYMKLL